METTSGVSVNACTSQELGSECTKTTPPSAFLAAWELLRFSRGKLVVFSRKPRVIKGREPVLSTGAGGKDQIRKGHGEEEGCWLVHF